MIPLVGLQQQHEELRLELHDAFDRVLARGNFVGGEELERFEQEWAKYCNAKYCIGVSNGTDAIYLAMRAADQLFFKRQRAVWPVPDAPRDLLVYAPAFTFMATVEPVLRAGGNPILIDVDQNAVLDNTRLEEALSSSWGEPMVLLPVHLYGYPYMAPSWLNKNVVVMEDAAQGHGIPLRPGVLAQCYSFYPTKNLGSLGQGGAVVTNDKDFADLILKLRNHGEGPVRFRHDELSGNYRLHELQAAFLNVKLPYLRGWTNKRRLVAQWYRDAWTQHGLNNLCPLQPDTPGHVYHIMAARVINRNGLGAYLKENGVQTAVRYPFALHQQPAMRYDATWRSFPVAEDWAKNVITFPMHEYLTKPEIDRIAELTANWFVEGKA